MKDIGITAKQSSAWQKLGKMSQDSFEAAIGATDKPSTKGIIRQTKLPRDGAITFSDLIGKLDLLRVRL